MTIMWSEHHETIKQILAKAKREGNVSFLKYIIVNEITINLESKCLFADFLWASYLEVLGWEVAPRWPWPSEWRRSVGRVRWMVWGWGPRVRTWGGGRRCPEQPPPGSRTDRPRNCPPAASWAHPQGCCPPRFQPNLIWSSSRAMFKWGWGVKPIRL